MPLPPARPRITIASDGSVLDLELETRWNSVKRRLTDILNKMNASGQPLKTMPQEWVHMYSDVASLYTHNDSLRKRRMYVYVRDFIRQLVLQQRNYLLPLSGPHLLSEYVRRWQTTLTYVKFMKRVLHHLQRFWIKDNANTLKQDPVRPLDKLLMFYWREDLLSSLHSVVQVALSLIDDDRNGIAINHDAVRGVVDNFVQLGTADIASPMDAQPPETRMDHFARYNRQASSAPTLPAVSSVSQSSPSDTDNDPAPENLPSLQLYHQVFEDDCLVRTRTFYKQEGIRMVEGANVGNFMRDIKTRMADEETRVKRLLHADSAPRVLRAVEDELIGNHKDYLQKEACEMIENGPENNLKLVYSLLDRIEAGLTPIRVFFVNHVRTEGNKLVRAHVDKLTGKEDMKHNLELVEHLIHLHRKHSNLVKRCFDGCQFIMMSIDDAFRSFLNRSMGNLSLPNVLAHFIDYILRNSKSSQRTCEEIAKNTAEAAADSTNTTGSTQAATEEDSRSQCLTEVVRLFMYLEEKDLFFEAHRQLFAERLLSTHDEEAEHEFVSKLKVQMGSTFTQRLNGMLKDVISSNDTRRAFEKYVHAKRQELPLLEESGAVSHDAESSLAIRTDFNAHVLSALHWPALKAYELRVPPILKACQDTFKEFYMRDKETRVLKWVPGLSTLHLKATFGSVSYTFIVSTFQACVLLLFNDQDEMTVGEASQLLNISIEELKRHIRPLLVGKKCKLLQLEKVTDAVPAAAEAGQCNGAGHAEKGSASEDDGRERGTGDSTEGREGIGESDLGSGQAVNTVAQKLQDSGTDVNPEAQAAVAIADTNVATVTSLTQNAEASDADVVVVNATSSPAETSAAPSLVPAGQAENQVAVVSNHVTGNSDGAGTSGNLRTPSRTFPRRVSLVITVAEATAAGSGAARNAVPPSAIVEHNNNGSGREGGQTTILEGGRGPAAQCSGRGGESGAAEGSGRTGESSQEKSGDGKGKRSRDILRLDLNFKSKLHRVVVPSTIAQVANNDTNVSRKNVVVDRSTQVDATVVRILKAKKQLGHSELFAEVIQALSSSFKPDPKLIKSRLERLIDQEYISRDSEDARLFKYNS